MNMMLTGYSWEKNTEIHPRIINAAERIIPAPDHIKQSRHFHWVINYWYAKDVPYRINDGECQVRQAKTLHLISPGQTCHVDFRTLHGKAHSSWIVFSAGRLPVLEPFSRFAEFLDPSGSIGELIRKTAWTGEQLGERGFWYAQGVLGQLLHKLSIAKRLANGSYHLSPRPMPPIHSEFVESVLAYIKKNLHDRLNLSGIAEHFHVSVSCLSHRFKKETGQTPYHALIGLRINTAKSLLHDRTPIKTISAELGFSDVFHFSKTFKQVTGMTPKQFSEQSNGNLY